MDVSMSEICCPECNMSFWLTWILKRRLEKSQQEIFCPNGHSIYLDSEGTPRKFSKGKAGEILKERIATIGRNLDQETHRAYLLKQSNAALRGVITRMKKR